MMMRFLCCRKPLKQETVADEALSALRQSDASQKALQAA